MEAKKSKEYNYKKEFAICDGKITDLKIDKD